ncbi:MAG: sigma-54-dependent Fis family transcriptional regulator [Deltaproteobacteria bacterium]|nr:sigma-54-dependent Fis family transcriptional regulator [Deltaproteobacteria bacterium]
MKSGSGSILVIDDDPALRQVLQEVLESAGFEVQTAADGESGLLLAKESSFDLVLTDLSLPGVGGMEILQFLVKHHPECPCIIITGFGTIKSSVDAMRSGAYDYLTKPVNPTELLVVVERALDHRRLKWENLQLKKQLQRRYGFANILGKSEAIQQVFEIIEKVADTDSTILIQGESGTGKELIARALHYNSSRREGPLIPVNCGAIPGELLESELFGHERGAFTHAVRTRIGRFELATGGTIFLDEIAEMSPNLQVKILRVLQDYSFERIGGVKTIRVNIRVIAATNKDLESLVHQGLFREDLYYRLNVIPIKVPPLRERESDIPLLARQFLKDFCARKKTPPKQLTAAALNCLSHYSWPGNVRELENLMERLAILIEGEVVDVAELPEKFHPRPLERLPEAMDFPERGLNLAAVVRDFEKNLILKALERSRGVKSQAAQLLHLNRTTLIEKMKNQKIQYPPATGKA